MVQYFITNIYHQNTRKYIDDDGSGVFYKQEVRNKYKSKYKLTYSNWYYVMKTDYIKDTIIRRTYSGIKLKEIGYVLITVSPYRDAEGMSQLRSYLRDAIINAAPRIGGKSTNQNFIDNVYLEGWRTQK